MLDVNWLLRFPGNEPSQVLSDQFHRKYSATSSVKKAFYSAIFFNSSKEMLYCENTEMCLKSRSSPLRDLKQ